MCLVFCNVTTRVQILTTLWNTEVKHELPATSYQLDSIVLSLKLTASMSFWQKLQDKGVICCTNRGLLKKKLPCALQTPWNLKFNYLWLLGWEGGGGLVQVTRIKDVLFEPVEINRNGSWPRTKFGNKPHEELTLRRTYRPSTRCTVTLGLDIKTVKTHTHV